MSLHARRELVWSQAKRYRDANRTGKKKILDEFCEATGFNRKYAIGLLNRPPIEQATPIKRRRASRFAQEDVKLLTRLWEISGRLCGKRLVPAIPPYLEALERHQELSVTLEQRSRLCSASASTVDRLLRPVRRRLCWRGKTTTRPGTLLKQQIAVRTFEWDEQKPGFFEADLVCHCGETTRGDYVCTLNLTDVATGWTEPIAIPNKGQRAVCDGVDKARKRLPFRMLGIDSDNGGEFINDLLKRYCEQNELTFTRSRPYKKNDQCHVESKNWSIVRVNTGYCRYETAESVERLARLYSWLRLMVNFFQPSMKLREKHRDGARLTRRHEPAATPYQRLLQSNVLSKSQARELQEMYLSLNPAELRRQIDRAQKALYESN